MTDEVDFDVLVQKTLAPGATMEDSSNLYDRAFALPAWSFIARGEFPNVQPYVAATEGYAGGKQMIRAFTSTERLHRFVRENNLAGEDGSSLILDLPTAGIVDYLENLIPRGVHGIWFNSDVKSDGFFAPLTQLRPIKEHLDRLAKSSDSDG